MRWSRSGRSTTTAPTSTPRTPIAAKHDKNFQGFGRFLTGSTGEYYFRTIKPVLYTGRTRHIHFKIRRGGKELLTTQCYVKGEPQNEKDCIYQSIRDKKARDVGHRRFHADSRLEDRRAGRQVRRRSGVHAGGVSPANHRLGPP